MLKIGEFSALSAISISMLRNYDKLGILVPTHVDQENGYRYYDKNQLIEANQIVSMKAMGFGLDEIGSLLQSDPEQKNIVIQHKLIEKRQELKNLVDQIHRLEAAGKMGKKEEEYALSIAVKAMPSMHVVCYRGQISAFNQEGILWEKLTQDCKKLGINVKEQALSMAIQHDFDLEKHYVDTEVMLETDRIYESAGALTCREIPKQEIASLVFQGSYMQISQINSFVAKWLEENHYQITGKPFSIYHMSPRESKEELQFITELCFPIRKQDSQNQ